MIILKRDDGLCLNLTAAQGFADHPKGMLVEMATGTGVEYFLTSIESTDALAQRVRGRFATMIVLRGHFEAWPQDTTSQ